jgi:hypothetical protein
MNKRKHGCLLCLAGLLAATAAVAMPVTQPVSSDPLLREQELMAAQAGQAARIDVSAVANNPALLALAKQPGAEFESILLKGDLLHGGGPRPSHRAEQELFGSAAKEGLISAEVKSVLKDLRGELHQLTGDHFRNAQATGEAEQAQLKRRLDQANAALGAPPGSPGRPISEEERRLGAGRVALLTDQLIEEVQPWAITAAVLFVLFHAAQALIRKQAAAKLLRGQMRREGHGNSSSPAAPAQALPAKGQGARVRQRIRLSSSSAASSRSRRRRPL